MKTKAKAKSKTIDREPPGYGYVRYPDKSTRPHCVCCGPFASQWMRRTFTGLMCEGCDNEADSGDGRER